MKNQTENRTWVEIDTRALAHNVSRLKRFLSKETKFMAVVKSNAYGHDMVLVARELEKIGVDFLAVDDFEEAVNLRLSKIKLPILVLGFTLPENFKEAAKKNISVTISSIESLAAALKTRAFARKLKIHIKVDTGLHRQGFLEDDKESVITMLSSAKKKIAVEGLYTHFAALESPNYIDYSRAQGERLARWQDAFLSSGFDPIVHASASAGIIWSQDDFKFDMVRAGIALYGLWPSEEIRESAKNTQLLPILSWKTVVGEIKKVPKGVRVGYDLTESVSRDSVIAVLPVGYWHGYPRSLSSRGEVLIKGKRSKVLGRVSMDMVVVDVTDIPNVSQGDEVILIGSRLKESVSAEYIAERAGTINYEIVTRINPIIRRITA